MGCCLAVMSGPSESARGAAPSDERSETGRSTLRLNLANFARGVATTNRSEEVEEQGAVTRGGGGRAP